MTAQGERVNICFRLGAHCRLIFFVFSLFSCFGKKKKFGQVAETV